MKKRKEMQVPFLQVVQRWICFMSNQADLSEAKTQMIIIIIIVVLVGGRYKVMAGNSPEMKWQKKKNNCQSKNKNLRLLHVQVLLRKNKSRDKEACEVQRALPPSVRSSDQ